IFAKLRDHQLGRGGQQIDLDEVERGLNREKNEQAERDSVEQLRVRRNERGVEEVPHDLGKSQRDTGASQQAHESENQSSQIRANPRQQSAQRAWGRNCLLTARRWTLRRNREWRLCRHAPRTLRSITIARKRSAR